jgi:hypothetical protein
VYCDKIGGVMDLTQESKILDLFYEALLKDLKSLNHDFEVLLNSSALRVVANLSTRLFQKRATLIIDSFSNILKVYEEIFEELVLENTKLSTIEGKVILEEKNKKFFNDLNTIIKLLNVKAQVINEDLKEYNLKIDSDTQIKLNEIHYYCI